MLDMKTALFDLGIAGVFFALMLSLAARKSVPKNIISLLGWAKLVQGTAFLLLSGRNEIPDFLSKNIGNSLLLGGLTLECIAAWMFVGRIRWKEILLPLLGVSILAVNTVIAARASATVMVIVASFIVAVQMIVCSIAFLCGKRARTSLSLTIGTVDLLAALAHIARGATALGSPDYALLSPSLIQYVAVLSLFLFLVTNGFGFLLLIKEEDDQRLRKSEERYRATFANSTAVKLIIDRQAGIIEDANPAAAAFYGYGPDRLRGMPSRELSHMAREDLFSPSGKVPGREPGHFFSRHRLADGKVRDVEVYANTFELDEKQLLMCIVHDITDRKRAEDDLWKQYELQRALLSAVPAYVYVKDTRSVYIMGNRRFSELSGIPEVQIPGKTDYDFFPKAAADSFRRNDEEVISTGKEKLNFEVKGADAKGNMTWYSTSKVPFRDPSGNVAGLVGISIDITDRKRAEEERLLFEQKFQQAQKAESLSRMAGAVAHHFNNLLGAVIGNLEIALDDLPRRSLTHGCISGALKASRRAVEISRFMLTYLGQTEGKEEWLDLSKTAREAHGLFCESLPDYIHEGSEFPSRGPTIRADGAHIRQILNHLLSNSVEAIPPTGGTVTVTVKETTNAEIAASKVFPLEWKPGDKSYACLEVADTGSGMDAATIERIFDPFFTTRFTGRGLGLSVVLGLMRACGGAVSVESRPGKYTVIRLYFPIVEPAGPHSRT
ncbi:MAG: PAS domain S-box protein [Syntrophobacteraceae bacterium]|nr:PAS domain S-box protein [Desulfobacteraceae bacterium]